MVAEGVGPRDRIAVLAKNDPACMELLFGGAMANTVHVAVNWRLTAAEVAAVINDAEARLVFVGPEFTDVLRGAEHELTTVKRIIALGTDGHPYLNYEAWLAGSPPSDPLLHSSPHDVVIQLYTSGTTGLPKGVMTTNANLASFLACGDLLHFARGSRSLVAMPLFHIGGLGWALIGLVRGCHCVLMPEFEAESVVNLVKDVGITHALLVPAMLRQITLLSDIGEKDLSSLRVLVYGASPISEELLETSMRLMSCGFYQMYGLTETTGAVTVLDDDDHRCTSRRDLLRSAGRPIGDAQMRIVDIPSGRDVAAGEVGEVWIRSAQVMPGYWQNEDATALVITEDGWFKTGDVGYLSDGYLYLCDRLKDVIVSGGENVYPTEIENVLMRHADVSDVAVIGVPSSRWGEEVKALVVAHATRVPTSRELMEFARASLGGYKVPKTIDFVGSLPRNASGKLLKKDLRAAYWAGHDRAIG